MASQTALCDVNDLRYQMFRIKKGDEDSGQHLPCKFKVPLCFMLCGPIIKTCVWKIYFDQKRITTAKGGMEIDLNISFMLTVRSCLT